MITHSRANLALTLTKLVLRTKDLIFMLLDSLEMFLGVCGMFSNSSKLKWPGEIIFIGLQVELAVSQFLRRHRNFRCIGHRFFLSHCALK